MPDKDFHFTLTHSEIFAELFSSSMCCGLCMIELGDDLLCGQCLTDLNIYKKVSICSTIDVLTNALVTNVPR